MFKDINDDLATNLKYLAPNQNILPNISIILLKILNISLQISNSLLEILSIVLDNSKISPKISNILLENSLILLQILNISLEIANILLRIANILLKILEISFILFKNSISAWISFDILGKSGIVRFVARIAPNYQLFLFWPTISVFFCIFFI